MKKRIITYRKRIDEILNSENKEILWEDVINEHLIQVGFFQHERLIHLIVTMTFAILTIISLAIAIIGEYFMAFILTLGFMVLLVPYVFHYYTLENEVQKMYEQYDRMIMLKNEK